MISATTTITNKTGLHARPASIFVMEAKRFRSDVTIAKVGGSKPISAKSIMHVLASSLGCGQEVVITCDGPDEQQALDAMVAIIESGLGE